jgi:hypothetical protein
MSDWRHLASSGIGIDFSHYQLPITNYQPTRQYKYSSEHDINDCVFPSFVAEISSPQRWCCSVFFNQSRVSSVVLSHGNTSLQTVFAMSLKHLRHLQSQIWDNQTPITKK